MWPNALLAGCLALVPSIALAQKSAAEKDLSPRRGRVDDGHVVLETKYGDKAEDCDHILAFSADGSVLATTPASDGGLTGWDAKTGEKVYDIRGTRPNGGIYCAWPDAGALVWTASKSLDLRDAGTGKTIRQLDRATKKIRPRIIGEVAVVSPDGQLIADTGPSRSDMEDLANKRRLSRLPNRNVVLHDTKSRQEKRAWRLPIPDANVDEEEDDAVIHVAKLAFSSDSTKVAAVLTDGQILAWDIGSAEPIATRGEGEISWKFNDNGLVRWLPENRGLLFLDSTGLREWLIDSPKNIRKVNLDIAAQDEDEDKDDDKKERRRPGKRQGKRKRGNRYPEPTLEEPARGQSNRPGSLIPACMSLDGRFAIRLRQLGGLGGDEQGLAAELIDLVTKKRLGELSVSRRQTIVNAMIAPQGNAVALELEDGVIHVFTMDEFQRYVTSEKQLAAVNPSRPERTEGGRRGRR